jgi:predicted GH43/DUF377 family glycosyl hydrolase
MKSSSRRAHGLLIVWLAAVLAAGCSGTNSVADGGSPSGSDAAVTTDGAVPLEDAGALDAGSPEDAGSPDAAVDAGEPDAGPEDAGCAAPVGGEPGPSGYALDGWNWQKQGLLLESPGAAAMDGYLSPALVEAWGKLHLYFARKVGVEQKILHSESADGLSWSAPQEVTGLGDGSVSTAPSVLFDGRKLRMWLSSGSFDLAESEDGVAWTVVAEQVFSASGGAGFDSLAVTYPSVVREGDGYALWYTGFDGRGYAIGRATSADGIVWTRSPESPVLQVGARGEFDNTAVAQARVLRGESGYRMWYGGYDTSHTNPGPYRIGLAESADGIAWSKRGVSVDLGAEGFDAYSTRDPAVIFWQGAWRMVYVGMGTDYRYRLLWARSETCVR